MKILAEKKWLAGILMIVCLSLGSSKGDVQKTYPLGDIPLDPETYESLLLLWPEDRVEAIPTSYDARDYGYVSSPKNQGNCGSCWAFASVGGMESHIQIEYGHGLFDLSEQQQVSCNTSMVGCCGGSMTSLQYWQTVGPITETCFPYGESGTSCPTYFTVPCSGASSCPQKDYRVTNYHTVASNATAMNTSLYDDGPSYWRFNVYGDFFTFWNSASPGTVYTQTTGTLQGGHAVLLIGWDDGKGAFLCKNSWGATGGPNGDGTFWIAYTGHAHGLGFGMANFDLSGSGYRYCFTTSSSDYIHEFDKDGMWLQGIATGSSTCGYDAIVKGGVYNGNWILIKDIPSASACVETVFYWGILPDKAYSWVNSSGGYGTGQMYACATGGGDQLNDESEWGEILDRKSVCLIDDWGWQYNLDISAATGGKKITGTVSNVPCDTTPLVTGMVRGDYFSFYVDIGTGDTACNEGFLVIGDVSTKSGQWINESGATGDITFTSCAVATEEISNKPSPCSKKW